jgi:LysM repeat protein
MEVDIYITEKSGDREIQIPILPEKININNGETTFIAHNIMDRGEVAVPSGTELAAYSWESEFPGELQANRSMQRGTWEDPETYDSTLKDWKANGTKLNLLVIGYPINIDVYLKTYNSTAKGPFGDIYYEIEFIEARDITITTSSSTTETKRSAETSSSYTIKSGDTLWVIAKKFYGDGSKWKTIYDANKDIIENTAKKYGRTSSDNGHWIYPGVKLTIPGTSAGGSTLAGAVAALAGVSATKTGTPAEKAKKVYAYLTQR